MRDHTTEGVNSIARFAVHRRVAVAMIATAIMVLGVFALPRLAVSLLPTFSPPVISVSVTYPNVAPESMETLVTRPIENAVSRVSGIDNIESTSSEGASRVRAQFHYGVNIDTAAVNVQEQVDRIRAQLPNDPTLQPPQINKFDPNSLPVVTAFVTDSRRSQRDLNDLFTNQLADEFSAITGVGSVSVNASQSRAIMIEPDAGLLSGYGLTAGQLVSRIKAENVSLPAGTCRYRARNIRFKLMRCIKTNSKSPTRSSRLRMALLFSCEMSHGSPTPSPSNERSRGLTASRH